MGETWNYGLYALNTSALLEYLQRNADSYITYHNFNESQKNNFRRLLSDISEGIRTGRITGNGYGNFSDSLGLIEESDITPEVFRYIHTVANAMGKKYLNKPEGVKTDDTGDLQDYNGDSHGFLRYFLEQTDPTLLNYKYTSDNLTDSLTNWRLTFDSTEEAVKDFSRMLNLYKNRHDYSKLNFSKMGTTSEQYLKDVDDLYKVTADGVLDKKDFRLLNKLGLLSLGPFLYNMNTADIKPEGEILGNTGEGILGNAGGAAGEGIMTKPEEVTFIKPEKALSNNENAWNYYVVAKNLFKEESDQYRFAGLMADIASIIDPEPFTAAGFGYASDTLNLLADEKDGINDNYWDDVVNYGLSTLGAVPILGDAGMTGKVGSKMAKYAKVIGALATAPALVLAYEQYPEIEQSIKKLVNDFKNCTVEDYRNIWTGIQIALGVGNVGRSWHAKYKAKQANDAVAEALVVKVKDDNGTTKELQFKGNDRAKLESLIDDPEGFKKYLSDNFRNLEGVELVNIGTKGGGLRNVRDMVKEKSLTKPKTKYVETRVAKVYDENAVIPSRWKRSRYFIDPGEKIDAPIKKTLEDLYGPKADTPKADTPTDTPTDTPKADIPVDTPKTDTSDLSLETFDGIIYGAPDVKPDITPDLRSGATGTPDIKSAVSSFTKTDIVAKLQGLSKKQGRNNALRQANNVKIDPSMASEVAKGNKIPSNGFNNLLSYLQKSGVKYDDAFKMLTEAGYYKKGGILKAEGGIKLYGSVNNSPFMYDESKYQSLWGNATIEGNFGNGSYRPSSSLSQKTSATEEELLDLNTYSKNFLPYNTSVEGLSNRIKDIYDVLENFMINGSTLELAIGNYNNAIDSFYTYKRNTGYKIGHTGEDVNTFNTTHKNIYRTPNSENGIYGYDSDLEHVNGTTTILRGVDITDNDIQIATDNTFTDGENQGTLKINNIVTKALGSKKLFKSKTGHLYMLNDTPDSNTPDGNTPDSNTPDSNADGKKSKTYTASTNNITTTPSMQKPDRPSLNFFTLDKALGVLNYYKALKHNKDSYKLASSMTPLLYDPLEHHRSILGNLRALMEGYRLAALLRSTASKPITSDASLLIAAQLESLNMAAQLVTKGEAMDDAAIRESSERTFELEKSNKESRYNIAMKNRENMHAITKEKLMALMAKKRSDYESGTNLINEWRSWILQELQKNLDKQEYAYSRQLLNYIRLNPSEYVEGWGTLHKQAWDNYNAGKTLTEAESSIVKQIERILLDAYYNELYLGKNNPYGIILPSWEDNYLDLSPTKQKKLGGKLIKAQADYVLKFLKESNANYNKAIERSIKGLYNHIKLQLRKK